MSTPLAVGDVIGRQGTTTGWPNPQILYGTNPVWTDGSDATYAEVQRIYSGSTTPTFIASNYAQAALTRTSSDPITSLDYTIRASARRVDSVEPMQLVLELFNAPDFGAYFWTDVTLPAFDGSTFTVAGTITDADMATHGTSFAAAAPYIDAGTYVVELSVSSSAGGATNDRRWICDVYEVSFGQVASTICPPLRQIRRSDGLAAGSPPRVASPAPSIQASNRLVGGYL